MDVPGEIIFFQTGPGLVLGLFDAEQLNDDLGGQATEAAVSGVTLSHNLDSPAAVDDTVKAAVDAGAVIREPPQFAPFGGITVMSSIRTASSGRSHTTPRGASTQPAGSASANSLAQVSDRGIRYHWGHNHTLRHLFPLTRCRIYRTGVHRVCSLRALGEQTREHTQRHRARGHP